jgi:hypothetical protein
VVREEGDDVVGTLDRLVRAMDAALRRNPRDLALTNALTA